MAIVLFLVNCHRACVGSLCVPARCGALCLLQREIAPQLSQSRAAGGGRGGGSGGSVQYLHSIYYIYTIYRGSALSTESPLSHCRGRDNAPAETRRGRPGAAAPRRNTETLIIFRLIMNTRQKCADWRRGIKKRRFFLLLFLLISPK